MKNEEEFSAEYLKYLELLSQSFPTQQATFTEIINLQAIVNLPKGTEHFMSDLHGEYEAFYHILNNCSGVIREKVETIFANSMTSEEQDDLLTLIYYPKEKLDLLNRKNKVNDTWRIQTLHHLLRLAKLLSSKYTRSKVRKSMPEEFRFVIDELIHAQSDEDNNRHVYHTKILDSIIETGSTREFIYALAALIKRLAVDHLHIIGDIYDRGGHADKIMDNLMQHHSLDIQWGNHDILWMGAAAGSDACIANVLRNNIRYNNLEILESGYGISLRPLALFARDTYTREDNIDPLVKAINVILFKLEGQTIIRHPEYNMDDRLLFHKMNLEEGTINIDRETYPLKSVDFPTRNSIDPYTLSPEEHRIVIDLRTAFLESERLARHMSFLYSHGSMYRCFNGNLLFHGGIPINEDGTFHEMFYNGKSYKGKAFMDYADRVARKAYEQRDQDSLDYMWYLWCGDKSPVSGRVVKTFERTYIEDKRTWEEPQDPYYTWEKDPDTCVRILHEFGIDSPQGHIINGHTPVKVVQGESPIRAGGKVLCIDGGFCRAYQSSTGIAGYTLIFNSHGLRIKAHYPFKDVHQVLMTNADIGSDSTQVEMEPQRVMIGDTDNGKKILTMVEDLKALLCAYRNGLILERKV
ncbi:MAG: fructose-1,6-bisphosphatase [Megasphaera sp.]|jgi:fructose-1,6-bisphosphatase-3|uniref:fructose-1,6-bisphosphatase n=1 Tax=Megasphaera sueciensis TaxID=349094 RepID=UPI002ACB0C76|nr:fructose-1,6-bisphosphatase [Megasphaera sp.]MCI1823005.1 fructose-1,6-bisphosphatase [Megasphaera sp.]